MVFILGFKLFFGTGIALKNKQTNKRFSAERNDDNRSFGKFFIYSLLLTKISIFSQRFCFIINRSFFFIDSSLN